jgi:mRNA-degrading endonuclease RelE of RelBE toxin-antitoxin system
LEGREKKEYKVVISKSAEKYFYEILEYFYSKYPLNRAEELANKLYNTSFSLNSHPNRGALEARLKSRKLNYRCILFNRTSRADIKIIYFVKEEIKTVFITDYFPTEMDDKQIILR